MNICATEPFSDRHSRFDPRALRDALGTFATGVTVTTTITPDGEPVGFTANSFTSVSLDPPLILVCIAERAMGYAAFKAASQFCVNILAAEQQDIAAVFASPGADKFGAVDWRQGMTSAPVLANIAAHVDCELYKWIDAGDHGVLVGHVVDFQARDVHPLCFHRGRYAVLETSCLQQQTAGGRP